MAGELFLLLADLNMEETPLKLLTTRFTKTVKPMAQRSLWSISCCSCSPFLLLSTMAAFLSLGTPGGGGAYGLVENICFST